MDSDNDQWKNDTLEGTLTDIKEAEQGCKNSWK